MRILTRRALLEFSAGHPPAAKPLLNWYKIVSRVQWRNFADTRRTFASADQVNVEVRGSRDPAGRKIKRTLTIFNIAGNQYRLIAAIHYNSGTLFIRRIMTHAEYSMNRWKENV